MTDSVHEYQSGDQNIAEQLETYGAFNRLMKWGSLAVAVLLVTLVLWFCVNAGFFSGLVAGLLVLSAGVYFLRSKPAPAH